jgi:hypothetical protein
VTELPDARSAIRGHLLGRLGSSDWGALTRSIEADELADLVDDEESRLIEEFVNKKLPATDLDAFFQVFLRTEDRKTRLSIAQGLRSRTRRSLRHNVLIGSFATLCALTLCTYAWREFQNQPQLVRIARVSQRSSIAKAEISLKTAKPTIILQLPESLPSGSFSARIGRIGADKPILETLVHSSGGTALKIPLGVSSLVVGDYILVVESGQDFRFDFLFAVDP